MLNNKNNFAEIFEHTSHRPYPIPSSPWIMKQVWLDLLFMHYKVSPDDIRKKIPKQLELDLWNGDAMLGIVPFRMEGIRPRYLPPVPWLSAFPELNVRTYVKHKGKPGVWFFSLDAANPIAVEIARSIFHLPYFNAEMSCDRKEDKVAYRSIRKDNRGKNAELKMNYEATSKPYHAAIATLEHWLTERYCLYAESKSGECYRGDIHHKQWELRTAYAQIEINTMADAIELDISIENPILHFVDRIEVGVYSLVKI
jgi:uncharacterized protein